MSLRITYNHRKMNNQKDWDQTQSQAVFQITSQHMGRLDYLYVFEISKMKKIGKKIGNFLDTDYQDAQLAAMNIHPNAQIAVGFKFPEEKRLEGKYTESVESFRIPLRVECPSPNDLIGLGGQSHYDWKKWQKQTPDLCVKGFIPEIYAIPQKYILNV